MTVVHPIEILHGEGVALACAGDGSLASEELHGLFAGDTRVLSSYRLAIAGHGWRLLSRSRPGPSRAVWDMQNPRVLTPGGELAEGTLHLRLRRGVRGALHDCIEVTSFAPRRLAVRLTLQIDADFSDVFQVKDRSIPPRLAIDRVLGRSALSLRYDHRGFSRGLHIRFSGEEPTFVGAQAVFDLALESKQTWRLCLDAEPEVDGVRTRFAGDPHAPDEEASPGPHIQCAAMLAAPFRQGCIDLDRLAVPESPLPPYIAAGAPWFIALFGRDTLVTSLMAGLAGSWHARGALAALDATRARTTDPERDAEPGKIAHELRRGELARFGKIPHTPYFGSHDAPALYVLGLWNAFRWTGDRQLLDQHLEAAEAALGWCDAFGDLDGDGLLEYVTRSAHGYRNQGWKDAGDAVPHDTGELAEPPVATVELQGLWYAARLAMAEIHDHLGRADEAAAGRAAALQLRRRVEERFWMDDAGCYALALDRDKRLVRSISSNPGHLLWCGLPSPERAQRVAERLLADDMFSGHGVRTLSADHPRYNPLSYQCGSVWPHDNLLFAAGLARYGLRAEAARVLDGVLGAAAVFEAHRLPELFCGFARDAGPPVPYEKANVPQAWSAAAPLLAAQILIGLVPDAPAGRCFVSPWLPPWLPSLELSGVELAGGALHIRIERRGDRVAIARAEHPSLDIVDRAPPAPLWGRPL